MSSMLDFEKIQNVSFKCNNLKIQQMANEYVVQKYFEKYYQNYNFTNKLEYLN